MHPPVNLKPYLLMVYASSKDVLIFDISAGWNLTGPSSNHDFEPLTSLPRKITANSKAQTSIYIIVERTLYVFSLIINITSMAPPKDISIQINCIPHFCDRSKMDVWVSEYIAAYMLIHPIKTRSR